MLSMNEFRGKANSTGRSIRFGASLLLGPIGTLALAMLLSGCAASITGIALDDANARRCDPTGAVCGIGDRDISSFKIFGRGSCGRVGINWGDGVTETVSGDFASTTSKQFIYASHQYRERVPSMPTPRPRPWPGAKTVHAFSALNCVGEARTTFNLLIENSDVSGQTVFNSSFALALAQPTASACNPVPGMAPLRPGATVFVSEIPGSPEINFGCWFGGCINDMGGNGISTDSSFPFPAMRRHSLVMRIVGATTGGVDLIQGQARRFSFPVTQDGALEFCVNDNVLTDNTGGWGIDISVNETASP